MSIDIQVIRDLERQFATLAQGQAEVLTYMTRYTGDNNAFGTCPRCFDEITMQCTDFACPDCFGTGYLGGYSTPITGIDAPYQRVIGFFSPNVVIQDWQQLGPISNEQNQIIYFRIFEQPAISDLIIDSKGNRYQIGTETKDWSYNNVRIGWQAVVFQRPPTSIVYDVQVPAIPQIIVQEFRSKCVEVQFEPDESQSLVFDNS